ncbi:MAG: diguanylate cyclase [Candidatus Baltobacteraceae bacterium]
MTAYLLFSQFAAAGKTAFLFIGAAYATTGLFTIPYLAAFPGVFLPLKLTPGMEQFSIWLWTAWHCLFPAIIGVCLSFDPGVKMRLPEAIRKMALRRTLAASFLIAIVLTTTLFFSRASLPRFALHGRFLPLFTHLAAPGLALFAFLVIAIVLCRVKAPTSLQYWLLVSLLAMGLDAGLNGFAPSRYTLSWYVGKTETLFTSSTVVIALLGEIYVLFRHLSKMTLTDPLTGIRNRRGFQEALQERIDEGRRGGTSFALFIIDIDHFKTYNDAYGHAAGDLALKRVAGALQSSLFCSSDFIARYGGEEFVVLLSPIAFQEASRVAERLRRSVESLKIPHRASAAGPGLTVSIGAACAGLPVLLSAAEIFEKADGALYEAKASGRNCVSGLSNGLYPALLTAGLRPAV